MLLTALIQTLKKESDGGRWGNIGQAVDDESGLGGKEKLII